MASPLFSLVSRRFPKVGPHFFASPSRLAPSTNPSGSCGLQPLDLSPEALDLVNLVAGGEVSGSGAKMTEAWVRNKPGMASVKDMPVLQDGPPPGGFAPVRYARRIPTKGPSAIAIFLTAFGAFAWGMYQVGQGNKVRRALKEEKIAARTALVPVLQAEEDERFVKEWTKSLMWEEIIMKDVPGWKVGQSVYNSGKWMPPATGELRRED
uniref:NADH dehydrogenase [ubiquinone] 1 alpha subcomplex subunit 13 n=1 Tax=Oryza meridionalis TaxID=40149 RepID=A0A0E0CWJ0_9ORYZ